MKKDTTWEKVAQWYDNHLEGGDTYHENVVGPQLIRMIGDFTDKTIVDVAWGKGILHDYSHKIVRKCLVLNHQNPFLNMQKRKDLNQLLIINQQPIGFCFYKTID